MNPAIQGEPTLTELDHVRLRALMRRAPVPPEIQYLVDTADLVPSREVQPDVVTMYSQVRLVDGDGDADAQRRTVAVCWPEHAEPEAGFVSVLSPLGAALLGRRVGDAVHWTTPDRQRHQARIETVTFQPEASGDYVT
jgi:regulator of nucleoside diphosphate kinase